MNTSGRGSISKIHQPCPDCGSRDALAIYDDHTYCYSCCVRTLLKEITIQKYKEHYASLRGLSYETVKFYDIRTRVQPDSTVLSYAYPYHNATGFKVRLADIKKFVSEGDMTKPGLFGRDKFTNGQAKCVTVTEGENDAASVYELLNARYPAVSVRSSSSAEADCKAEFDFLNSFDKIYLALDSDEPGQKAAAKVANLFDVNKVYHVKFSRHKDANEYLTAGDGKELVQAWWNAKRYQPKGIISSYVDIDAALDGKDAEAIATYPFPTLQDMTYGIRLQELNLIKAQEKVGKTEFMRAMEHHVLKTTDYNIGIIHLEEKEKRTIRGLVGYELAQPCHLPDSMVAEDQVKKVYRELTKRDDRICIYTHFGSDDPDSILSMVRYMATINGCKVIFLDHITMLVTSQEVDDDRKKLDYISTKLATMTRDHDFCLFLVSHVNEQGSTRGSKNISKVADLIVHLTRDIKNEDMTIRNQMKVMVDGNRYSGTSGPAGTLQFDPTTYQLKEIVPEVKDAFLKGF